MKETKLSAEMNELVRMREELGKRMNAQIRKDFPKDSAVTVQYADNLALIRGRVTQSRVVSGIPEVLIIRDDTGRKHTARLIECEVLLQSVAK